MPTPNIRPWQRDLDVMQELTRWPMTTSLLADLYDFPSSKKGAERFCHLHRAGLLKRVPYFQPAKQGKPEFVYCTGTVPKAHTLAHTIGIATVRVQAALWLRTSDWSGDFYYTHEVPTTGGIIPDATLIVRKGEKAGLYFFEVDNGTEPITSMAGYSLAKKLALYAAYFDGEAYARDFAWAGAFRGFRACLIVPPGRLRHVQQVITTETHDFALSTTFDLLKRGFDRPVWTTADNALVDLFGRGEVLGELVGEEVEPTLPSILRENVCSTNDFRVERKAENPTGESERRAADERTPEGVQR